MTAGYESQNMLMTSGYCILKHFCSVTFTASEISHISTSNISLFLPWVAFCFSHSLSCFHTTAAPVSPRSSLDLLHQKMMLAWSPLAIAIALHFSSIKIFPGKTYTGIAD